MDHQNVKRIMNLRILALWRGEGTVPFGSSSGPPSAVRPYGENGIGWPEGRKNIPEPENY